MCKASVMKYLGQSPAVLLIALILLSRASYAEQTADGIDAYNRKNYSAASKILKIQAKLGDAVAQRYLAEMFDKGIGMSLDYKKAIFWYQKAAIQHDAAAQYRLGIKYANGHGVLVNNIEAYAWFALAFDNGYQPAVAPLKVMNKTLSTSQRQKALRHALARRKTKK
jgi:TPR repeat protein